MTMARRPARLLLATALALGACRNNDSARAPTATAPAIAPRQVVGLARIEAAGRTLTLGHDRGGTVVDVPAAPGATVRAGQPIVVFARDQESARLREAEAEAARLDAQARGMAARLRSAELNLEAAASRLDQARELSGSGAVSGADIRTLELDVESLRAALASARAERDALTEAARAARARRDQAQAALDDRAVRAPADGAVLQVMATPGQYVDARRAAELVSFAPAGARIAVAEVDELFADRVRIGQPGAVRRLGSDEIRARGRVAFLAPALSRKSFLSDSGGEWQDRRVRELWLQLDEDDAALLTGTRVEVVIDLDDVSAAPAP